MQMKRLLNIFIILISLVVMSSAAFAGDNSRNDIPQWAKHYFDNGGSAPQHVPSRQEKIKRLKDKTSSIFGDEYTEKPVIIRLNSDFVPEGFLAGVEKNKQRKGIKAAQDSFQKKLIAKSGIYSKKVMKKFDTIPFVQMVLNHNEISELYDIDEVADIEEDSLASVSMAESNPLIGSNVAWASGADGAGQTVAILDTGVAKTHPFLQNKVISEACYSNAGGAGSGVSVCPGGVTSSTAAGSGVNCSAAVSGCDHGTHVAGIAAGNNGSLYGVAKNAKVIAIQVFTNIGNEALSYTSDQIKGLERVYALKDTYEIASANMSLGGGQYTSYCDNDPRKVIIDNLRSAGIATVIASGNNGYTNAVSAPACISTAIAVGSTKDGSLGTVADTVSSFSNSSALVDLLAPGQYIYSSVPGGGYANWQGTSMAAPHVAGAFAAIKSLYNIATVTEIETALINSGKPVTDSKNNITKPRIDLGAALNELGTGTVTVTIAPAAALSDGAKWQVDGGPWQDSGATEADVPVGNHSVTFKPILHSDSTKLWIMPPEQQITISSDGQAVSASGTYTESQKNVTSRDSNLDGKADILFRNHQDGSFYVYSLDSYTIISHDYVTNNGNPVRPNYPKWLEVGFDDMNGDGKSDILFRNTEDGSYYSYMLDDKAVISQNYITYNGNPVRPNYARWKTVGLDDMNGDGKADILFRNIEDGSYYAYILDGNTIIAQDYIRFNGNPVRPNYPKWKTVGLDDVNGDGKADILFRNIEDGSYYIYILDGTTITAQDYVRYNGNPVKPKYPKWLTVGFGDVNGDGKADILFRNTEDGSYYIYILDGTTITAQDYAKFNGNPARPNYDKWKTVGFNDVSGDGKVDIIFRNTIDGSFYVYIMDGTAITSQSSLIYNGVVSKADYNIWSAVNRQ